MGRYYKILLVSVGLLSGIIIGGLIVYFILGGSVRNIYIFNHPVKDKEKHIEDTKNDDKAGDKTNKKNSQVVIKYLIKDEANNKVENISNESKSDTDTSIKNNSVFIENELTDDEDIIVKKDEMIFSEILMIILLDSLRNNASDSLAKMAANIKEPAINQFYQVEYWKSPLNYKGYKFSKNKLVVYGIEYLDKDTLFRWRDNFYFKANGRVYALDITPEFKSYETVNNQELLRLIEKKSNAN